MMHSQESYPHQQLRQTTVKVIDLAIARQRQEQQQNIAQGFEAFRAFEKRGWLHLNLHKLPPLLPVDDDPDDGPDGGQPTTRRRQAVFGVGPAEAVAGPGHDGNASVDSGAPRRRATSPFRSLLEDDVRADGRNAETGIAIEQPGKEVLATELQRRLDRGVREPPGELVLHEAVGEVGAVVDTRLLRLAEA